MVSLTGLVTSQCGISLAGFVGKIFHWVSGKSIITGLVVEVYYLSRFTRCLPLLQPLPHLDWCHVVSVFSKMAQVIPVIDDGVKQRLISALCSAARAV